MIKFIESLLEIIMKNKVMKKQINLPVQNFINVQKGKK